MLQIGRNGVVVTECNKLSGRNPGQHYPPPPHFQRKSQRCISEKTSKVFGVNQYFFAQDHRGDGLNQSRQRRDIFWRTASAVKIHSQQRKKKRRFQDQWKEPVLTVLVYECKYINVYWSDIYIAICCSTYINVYWYMLLYIYIHILSDWSKCTPCLCSRMNPYVIESGLY